MTEMDFERIGRAMELLLANRMVRRSVTQGRVGEQEAECSGILLEMSDGEREVLEKLLAGQGWELVELDSNMPGIPRNSRCWLLVRRHDANGASLLTMERAWLATAARADEKREVTIYWFTFIWLISMSLMYERSGRSLSEVSRYIEAVLTRDEIEKRVMDQIEELRVSGASGEDEILPVVKALTENGATKNAEVRRADIRRRVGKFLDVMVKGLMLEEYRPGGDLSFRQTLLSAVQIDRLYSAELVYLVPPEQTVAEMDRILVTRGNPAADGAGANTYGDHV